MAKKPSVVAYQPNHLPVPAVADLTGPTNPIRKNDDLEFMGKPRWGKLKEIMAKNLADRPEYFSPDAADELL